MTHAQLYNEIDLLTNEIRRRILQKDLRILTVLLKMHLTDFFAPSFPFSNHSNGRNF